MIVGVPRESFPGELRVALTPAVIPGLAKAGLEVVLEAGAGVGAGYPDADYVSKGAKILPQRAEVFRTADIVVQVLCYGSNDKSGKGDLPLFRRDQIPVSYTHLDVYKRQTQPGQWLRSNAHHGMWTQNRS